MVYPLLDGDVSKFYDPMTGAFHSRFEGDMTVMDEVMWEFDIKFNCWLLLVSDSFHYAKFQNRLKTMNETTPMTVLA